MPGRASARRYRILWSVTVQLIETGEHHLLVLKPAGIPCELPYNKDADTLLRRLELQGFDGLRLVHRLDAPTSGLMLLARSADAAAYYSREIAERRWGKWYVARVGLQHGRAVNLCGEHKAYLKTDGRHARVVRSGGKPSFLEITNAVAAPSGRETDLLIRLHTGRFHQIRVMLGHLGAPLTGDEKYGGDVTGPMFLEHVMLAVREFESQEWRVWVAPDHADRPAWSPALTLALEQQREKVLTELHLPTT